MTINQLAKEAYDNAVAHGFYADPPSIDRRLMLIVSELVEAHDELRNGHSPTDGRLICAFDAKLPKPCGFGSELADAIIRICDLAHAEGLDLEALIAEKQRYNFTRPFKHGKAF